jgi:hypothetical protein
MSEVNDTMAVEYRVSEEFPCYRAGTDGTAWSQDPRFKSNRNSIPWTQLKPRPKKGGYWSIVLYKDRKPVPRMLQRFILETFVGPCPPGMEACHKDHNPSNNSLGNLEWGTHQDNMDQSTGAGRINRGNTHPRAVFVESDILDIRRDYFGGWEIRDLAERHHVGTDCINSIVTGRTWKHVGGLPSSEARREALDARRRLMPISSR